ncbi:FAD-dependent oxidoreductase [Mesorhizobium sp. CAU 1741]|uniref:FAD-dependent oxidoreductase n=1 Tax=Mesorhizobium sp. CAU 1741 TaxID=3140366 RepID=UPI00325B6026
MHCNVVVVGSGAAGLMAAIEAADLGASVIVLESEPHTGGSTRLSGAYVALCETPLQPGTRDELYEDLIHSHHEDCQESLSRLYVDEAAATYSKLETLGVRFVRTFRFAHMSRPWAHELSGDEMSGGAEIVTQLEAAARARGVRLETEARVRRLVIANGEVTGVAFEWHGMAQQCTASNGVILATGGFTRNQDLIHNFGPPGAEGILPLTGQGSRGDGLLMGMSAGAGISYMTMGVAPTAPSEPETGKGAMVLYAGAIALNRDGKRFCRESELYIDTCWALLKQPGAVCAQIYDSRMKGEYEQTMMGKVLTGFREFQAPTLSALAMQLSREGFDAKGVVSGVERYNGQLGSGGDTDFERRHAVGDSGPLLPISKSPFHAVICRAGTTHFNGGLTVDTAMNVRDVYGNPIAGLYAAGEVTGGFHGAGYMSGTFVGMALIFGRVAGRSAALA